MMDLVTVQTIGVVLAALTSALGLAVLLPRPRGRLKWTFGVGMFSFAAEAVAILMLVARPVETSAVTLFWLRAVLIAGFVVPLSWGFFVKALAYPLGTNAPRAWRLTLTAGVVLAIAGSLIMLDRPASFVVDHANVFDAARLDVASRLGVITQLLMTVALLSGLEVCLRTSSGLVRWRMKYLLLGLGAIFLARFYLLSNIVLFSVVWAVYLKTAAATLFVGNVVIAISLARDRLAAAELRVSRQVAYRSVVVGVLGIYLLVVGVLGSLLQRFEIPHGIFWGSLMIFVSGLAVVTVLLSDALRWRVTRFIALHFYRSKYDYREQWKAFTERIGSLLTLKERAPHLLEAVTRAVGTTEGALYLASAVDNRYRLAAEVGESGSPQAVEGASWIVERIKSEAAPLVLQDSGDARLLPEGAALASRWAVIVPLTSRASLLGFMLIGHERTGAPYGVEDAEFLAAAAEHVASALGMAQLSEAVAQAREFEAFHRLTSFVIHDLKNSVSALSILSRNALHNFDDPEFQRDAIKTVSSTVARMKTLLARLTSPVEASDSSFEDVDLAALAHEALSTMSFDPSVVVVKDLRPLIVRGDSDALLKIVQNLVTNAAEAIDGRGTIEVRTYQDQAFAVVSVRDTGRGIPEQFLRDSLFVPFRSTKQGGWGVGLYQAREIVDRHHGTLSVASEVGRGATFCVRLPLAVSAGAGAAASAAEPHAAGTASLT